MIEEKERKRIFHEVILGYRKVIEERYDFKNIQKRSGFPKSFNEEIVNKFKSYFLNYIYPLPDKREELNETFESLDSYITHPDKLLRLLIDSSSLIFKYGRHLPKILTAGIRALRSFRRASKFEEKLVEKAILLDLKPPYNKPEIDKLISTLSLAEIEEFIESSQQLFETLYDRELVDKVKKIVDHLIKKMKSRPNVYSTSEVKGLELGQEILVKGDLLFDELGKEEQERIFTFIIAMEREVLSQLFSKE